MPLKIASTASSWAQARQQLRQQIESSSKKRRQSSTR